MDSEFDDMIRSYADGKLSWEVMRGRGLDNYADLLAGLERLGLRPPIVPVAGPNAAARQLGIDTLDAFLAGQLKP